MEIALRICSGSGFGIAAEKPKAAFFRVKCSVSSPYDTRTTSAVCLGDRPWKTSDARLVLEDGSVWKAKSFGATGTQVGEVVFKTSLTGLLPMISESRVIF